MQKLGKEQKTKEKRSELSYHILRHQFKISDSLNSEISWFLCISLCSFNRWLTGIFISLLLSHCEAHNKFYETTTQEIYYIGNWKSFSKRFLTFHLNTERIHPAQLAQFQYFSEGPGIFCSLLLSPTASFGIDSSENRLFSILREPVAMKQHEYKAISTRYRFEYII